MTKSSLQKRLLWVAIPLVALISAVIIYSQYLVNQTADSTVNSVADIRNIEREIHDIRTTLQILQRLVYQHTVIAYQQTTDVQDEINKQTQWLNTQIEDLLANKIIQTNLNSSEINLPIALLMFELEDAINQLKRHLKYYNYVVSDVRIRFPGLNLLTDMLLPANNEFIQALDLAIQEINDGERSPTNTTIRDALLNIRYSWSQQVSWFRLFVANRSGLFGTPYTSMKSNIANREIFNSDVKRQLDKLKSYDQKSLLGLQASDSLEIMYRAYNKYETNVRKAVEIYTSEEWRIDHLFLNKNLIPQFDKTNDIIDKINQHIKTKATEIIANSYATAKNITVLIWVTGIVVIALIILGYFGFEYIVRRPLIQVSQALNAEAQGTSFSPILKSQIQETAMVLDAFHNMQEQVHSRQVRLEAILNNAAEGIITINGDGTIETFNVAAEHVFGYNKEEVLGEQFTTLIPDDFIQNYKDILRKARQGDDDHHEGDKQLYGLRKDGSTFPAALKISELIVSEKTLYTVMVEDITERIAMIKNLRNLAEHDSLTNLFNRYYFLQELERIVDRANRGVYVNAALLYIDLDNFKYVNDSLGHLAGDKLLVDIANILKRRGRKSDLIARLGGDEFAIILYDVDSRSAVAVADSFRQQLQDYHFICEGKVVDVGCSVGVAMIESGADKEEVLSRADYSCHAAKRAGRNKIHLYTEHDQQNIDTISDDMGWTHSIKQALEHNRFMLVMQPIMSSDDDVINHHEVLLRMLDDDGKFIMPSGFLPPAERFGLMSDVDRWVVHHAIILLLDERNTHPNTSFSINLSAQSLSDNTLIDFITQEIHDSGIEPSALTFEVTETVAMSDIGLAAQFLDNIRALGCFTALDDFGVGYSSFAYLKDLPVDYVKIDGSFVKDIDTNELNKAIVKSMHDVASAMGKKTVAEFVGSARAIELLKLIGVDYQQGYYIGEPTIPPYEKKRITMKHTSKKISA